MPPSFNDIDKLILNRIQSNFPIASRPYAVIADELGLTEKEVLDCIAALKAKGIIRRIGGNFSPEKLGFFSTLCAAKVPPEKIEFFAETVNRYPGVTHNYQRDNDFNIWFTFIAPSRGEIEKNLAAIAEKTGVSEILNLPATRLFKISARFTI